MGSVIMLLCMIVQILFPLTGIRLARASEISDAVKLVNEAESLDAIQAAIESPDLELDLTLYSKLTTKEEKLSVAQAVYNERPYEWKAEIQVIVDSQAELHLATQRAAMEAVNNAETAEEMQAAMESEALSLDLTRYHALTAAQQTAVAEAVLTGKTDKQYETKEEIQAVINAQVMMFGKKIVILTGRTGFDLLFNYGKENADYSINLQILRVAATASTLANALTDADTLIVFTHSGTDTTELEKFREVLENYRASGGIIVIPTVKNDTQFATVKNPEHPFIERYWINGGGENIRRLYNYVGHHFLGLESVPVEPPVELPVTGIYHPKAPTPFVNLESYLEWYKDHGYDSQKPLVGMKFFKTWVAREQLDPVNALVASLEAKGANVVPIYLMNAKERAHESDYDELSLFKIDGQVMINSLVNYIHHGGPAPHTARVEHLAGLDVPLLHAVVSTLTVEQWELSTQGMPVSSIHMLLIPPELRGSIDPVVVAAGKTLPSGDTVSVAIPEQVEHFAGRVMGWSMLGIKPNSEKKVAIIYYNYPSGKSNPAGASNLNVFRSLPKVLEAMADTGYNTSSLSEDELEYILTHEVRNIGSTEKHALKGLVENGNVALLPEETYLDWFYQLPQEKQDQLVAAWGPAPGDTMVYTDGNGKRFLVIPRLQLGNVIVAPQPLRADAGDDRQNYHSTSLPPTHQYVAFYLWLNNEFGADAIIHFGTHGTLEFLPGKERLLAAHDWPMLLVQDMPVIYPYIMDNLGEGLTARRRGSAVLISHLTPPLIAAGLYGELVLIHDYIHYYYESGVEIVQQGYREAILKLVSELHLHHDMGVDLNNITDFDEFLTDLHLYLHELEDQKMPYGMHTFGQLPDEWLLVATVREMLGKRYKKLVEEMLEDQLQGLTSLQQEKLLEETVDEILNRLLLEGLPTEVVQDELLGQVNEELTALLNNALKYWNDFLDCKEIEALLGALSGKYIMPGPGGDPLRNPGAIPTGRNLTAIDPATIPTPVAWAIGKKLTDDLLADYYAKHGQYPDKIAISLWGGETLRTHGVAEAQALYLLGVEPIWQGGNAGGLVTGVKLIPREQLGRPRIDVVMSITGIHRDLFPNLIVLLHKAVMLAAQANEEDNYVRQNTLKLLEKLESAGITGDQAFKLATGRIFSAETGGYGTGLTQVENSGSWETDLELAEIYFQNQGYLYGDGIWSQLNTELFKDVLSGTKLALLTRSSNLYGMLTTDDPYQYLGGLGLAIRTLDGTTPELWIANLRDPNNARMQTAEKFLTDELRSRYWNELWIEGQINEGLSGASQIARVLENLWGWQVMAPEIVGDFMWETFKAIYVDDKYNMGINDWFNQHNPYAFQSLVGRMLEAIRKDYWDASEDTIRQLTDAYSRSVNQFGPAGTVHLNSPQFRAFLDSIQSTPTPISAIDNSTQLPIELVQLPQESIEMPAIQPGQPPAIESTSSVPAEPNKTNERSPEITVSPVSYQPKPAQQKNEEKSIDEPVAQEENAEAVQEKTEEPKTKAYELKKPDEEREKQKLPAAVLPGIALAVSGIVGLGNILTKRKFKLQ